MNNLPQRRAEARPTLIPLIFVGWASAQRRVIQNSNVNRLRHVYIKTAQYIQPSTANSYCHETHSHPNDTQRLLASLQETILHR